MIPTSFFSTLRRWIVPVIWLAIFTLSIVVFVLGMAVWFPRMQQVCQDSALTCQQQLRLSAAESQELMRLGYSLAAYAWFNLVHRVLIKALGLILGAFIFLRRPSDRLAFIVSLFLIIGLETSVAESLAVVHPAWWLPTHILGYLGSVCFSLFFYLFPNGKFVPGWTKWAAVVWGLIYIPTAFFPASPLSLNQNGPVVAVTVGVLLFGSLLVAQVYRFRKVSTPIERMQTKWVVFATILGLGAFLVAIMFVIPTAATGLRINRYWVLVSLAFQLPFIVIPLAIAAAILRYRLWDIDVIIRRTLSYGALTLTLALAYFGSVLLLQNIFQGLTGERQSPIATVISTLVIAALFQPLRRRIQNDIDRRFYRQKYDAERALASFGQLARQEVDLEGISDRLLVVVRETVQPQKVSLWLKRQS